MPKVEFYQLKISYDTLTVEKANPEVSIEKSVDSAQIAGNIIKTTDLSMNVNNISIQVDDAEYGTEYATFNSWIYGIMRSGFGTPSMAELNAYTEQLKVVYEKITYEKGGSRYFSSKYNKKLVEANIRKAFCDKTDFNTTEELIPEEANLLNIANFTSEIYADNLDDYYPRQNVVENIMADDQGKLKVDKKTQQLIDLAKLVVEHALKNKYVSCVVCTSTLAQGVNIPIKYLLVTSIRNGLKLVKARDFQNLMGRTARAETLVNDSKKSAVDICTNTLAYAMATEKEKELLIKVFQKIEENIQQYSVEKLSRYSNAMSGIGLSSLIEEWIVQNELTEKIYTETELLYVITER